MAKRSPFPTNQIIELEKLHRECDNIFQNFVLFKQALSYASGMCKAGLKVAPEVSTFVATAMQNLQKTCKKPETKLRNRAVKNRLNEVWAGIGEIAEQYVAFGSKDVPPEVLRTMHLECVNKLEPAFVTLLEEINIKIAGVMIQACLTQVAR
jgi:hypothetical protein